MYLTCFKRDARPDIGDSTRLGQAVDDEVPQADDIGHDDAQQVVGIAGHQVAFHYFGKIRDRRFERFQGGFRLLLQRYPDENADARSEFGRVEQGDPSQDDGRLFQSAHSGQAWRRRKADPFGEFDIGEAAVLLQLGEDA